MKKQKPSLCGEDLAAAESSKAADYFDCYSSFARAVRTWFIAYGIGAPVFLVSTSHLWKSLAASGYAKHIACLYLAGVLCQMFLASIYKAAMWQLYVAEEEPQKKTTWLYEQAEKIAESYPLELICDIITFALFFTATIMTIYIMI